jgi:hypothetical protein
LNALGGAHQARGATPIMFEVCDDTSYTFWANKLTC